jgi:hypothetical protein
LGCPGAWALLTDYLAFAALFAIGLRAVRTAPSAVVAPQIPAPDAA